MQYVGVDHHKRFSYLTVMDKKGNIIKKGEISNTKESLKRFLNNPHSKRPVQAVLEAGRNWTVMYDWLEEELDKVKLAHPYKTKAIAEAKIKTDKISARTLAHLLRTDLIPEAYVPDKETRHIKNILRQRMFFVRLSTMVKNRIYLILDRHPELKQEFDFKDLFTNQERRWLSIVGLPEKDRKLLAQELDLLEALEERIKLSNSWVKNIGKDNKLVKLLMTIPGIGKFFALLILVEIDDISRFRNKNKLCAYAGLIPSLFSSGDKSFTGKITKQGNKYLRWAMIEAVWPAIRKDLRLRAHYQRIKVRKGSSNKAKVATARKLLTIVYQVLKNTQPYRANFSGYPHFYLAKANN